MLSVPGKIGGPSVESLMRQRWHVAEVAEEIIPCGFILSIGIESL